jgi:integrase
MARPKNSDRPDLAQAIDLTSGAIARLACPPSKQQAFLRDSKTPGLRVRVTTSGVKAYVFEAKLNRQTIRRTIGDVKSWSIEQARTEARRLSVLLDNGIDPREVVRQLLVEKTAKDTAEKEAVHFTLRNLLNDYVERQNELGRQSARDARSIFALHVFEPWPKVSDLPANLVTGEQVGDMMRRLFESGYGRTANKLRSYVRAAYALAKDARAKASIPVKFKSYNIRMNPADDTKPETSSNLPDKRPLNQEEMQAYWEALQAIEGIKGAVLRLHLLTGGQRIAQLVKLRTADIQEGGVGDGYITIFDGKGKPGTSPRPHNIPLTDESAEALLRCEPQGVYALSTDGGVTHIGATTLGKWAKDAAPSYIEDFTAKRIRSGVETLLASARISKDIRGRLQSHGVSGVQDRHYDGHDYMLEKYETLETLLRLLTFTKQSNVLPLKTAA